MVITMCGRSDEEAAIGSLNLRFFGLRLPTVAVGSRGADLRWLVVDSRLHQVARHFDIGDWIAFAGIVDGQRVEESDAANRRHARGQIVILMFALLGESLHG